MSKIIAFPQTAPKLNQVEEPNWIIKIGPKKSEDVTAYWIDEIGWSCMITAPSFDRLPALLKEALKQLKIAKATEGGAVL